MTDQSLVAMAARHVAEGEARVARLEAIIAELERDNHPDAAASGQKLLATVRQSLAIAVTGTAKLTRAAR